MCIRDRITDQGFQVEEKHLKPEEMKNYEEAFLTGTAAEITPIQLIDETKFNTGEDTKTFQFMQDFHQLVRS